MSVRRARLSWALALVTSACACGLIAGCTRSSTSAGAPELAQGRDAAASPASPPEVAPPGPIAAPPPVIDIDIDDRRATNANSPRANPQRSAEAAGDFDAMLATIASLLQSHREADAARACERVETSDVAAPQTPEHDSRLAEPQGNSIRMQLANVCRLDVPLANAKSALEQVRHSPSQASRRLMCGLAAKDIASARRAGPRTREQSGKIANLHALYASECSH